MTRGRAAAYTSAFRLALTQHLRPTAVLFRDPHFGHRNSFTMQPDPGDSTQWTSWDYAIGTAMQIIEDGTTEEGHLIWEAESPDVFFEAVKKFNHARGAIDRITGQKDYQSVPGEYYITTMHQQGVDPGQEKFYTRREWIEKKMEEAALEQGPID